MALILIFSLSLQAPFPPLGDPSRVAGGGGWEKKAASAQLAERGERRQKATKKLKVMCSRAGNGKRAYASGRRSSLARLKTPKQGISLADSSRFKPFTNGLLLKLMFSWTLQEKLEKKQRSAPGWGCAQKQTSGPFVTSQRA